MGAIIPNMGTIRPGLSETLFTKTQRGVLSLLFNDPERSYYANEIVRHARAGIGTVQRELGRLVAAGLLTVARVGNQKHYRANRQSPIFDEMEVIVLKTMARASRALPARPPAVHEARARYDVGSRNLPLEVPKRRLEALCRRHGVKRLGVFGSAARGETTGSSDIDLLVEFGNKAQTSLFDMVRLKEDLSRLFGRKVDLATPAILENPYRRRSVLKDLREIYAA
jgi:predicted nucleotidyltransferase